MHRCTYVMRKKLVAICTQRQKQHSVTNIGHDSLLCLPRQPLTTTSHTYVQRQRDNCSRVIRSTRHTVIKRAHLIQPLISGLRVNGFCNPTRPVAKSMLADPTRTRGYGSGRVNPRIRVYPQTSTADLQPKLTELGRKSACTLLSSISMQNRHLLLVLSS